MMIDYNEGHHMAKGTIFKGKLIFARADNMRLVTLNALTFHSEQKVIEFHCIGVIHGTFAATGGAWFNASTENAEQATPIEPMKEDVIETARGVLQVAMTPPPEEKVEKATPRRRARAQK